MGSDLSLQPQQPMGLDEQMRWAQAVSKAGILPDAYRGRPADVLVAVGFGQSMGLSPAESLYRINVVKGKPTMSAELIGAQVRKAGHKLRISKDEKRQSVTATIVRRDDPDYPISVTRDKAWADAMNLTGKGNYQSQLMTMLTWRAITAVAREACPEALFGVVYSPDEMHDFDNSVTVEDVRERGQEEPGQAEDKASGEVPVQDGEVMATAGQADAINRLVYNAGVDSPEKARVVFRVLAGRDIDSARYLSQIDAENLLSAPDLVASRTKEALREYAKTSSDAASSGDQDNDNQNNEKEPTK